MHGVAILLVCVCAAFASHNPKVYRRQIANKSETADLPVPFNPPPYIQYLEATDETIATIVKHFHPKAYDDVEDTDFRYIVLTSTYYALAQKVNENGWEEYNSNYGNMVKDYMNHAMLNTHSAAKQLKCSVLMQVLNAVKTIREVTENFYIQYICRVQPHACNAAIWAVIHYNHDEPAIKSAAALEVIGEASEIFLADFSKSFEAVSALNVYKHIYISKEVLRPLVDANNKVIGKIQHGLVPDCHLNSTETGV